MKVVCLDFEGVLVPDIWPFVAQNTNVKELNITTRDVKDYRELMQKRVEICKANNIDLKKIVSVIEGLQPLDGALEFVEWIKSSYQFIILSDTFYEFVPHFMKLFGYPSLFCHSIQYNYQKSELEFFLRQDNQKQKAVEALKSLNFKVYAAGDSYNDVTMLHKADAANLFCAPKNVSDEFPQYKNLQNYEEMKEAIRKAFE